MNHIYRKIIATTTIGFFLFLALFFTCPTSPRIFNDDGTPSAPLSSLLNTFNISAQTPLEINASAQEKWLRTPDKERWEAEDPYASRKEELMPLFKQMGLIDEIYPAHNVYDYVLIMGALFTRAKSRMEYAVSLWNKGIRFKNIVILGSERTLNPEQEPSQLFGDINPPQTEYEMMCWVYEHIAIPTAMKNQPTIFINAPNKIDAHGKIQRATTADTIAEWLKGNPLPGRCLVISNQPHVHYQERATALLVPHEFIVEGTGAAMTEQTRVTDILDALARWIYQEYSLFQMRSCFPV